MCYCYILIVLYQLYVRWSFKIKFNSSKNSEIVLHWDCKLLRFYNTTKIQYNTGRTRLIRTKLIRNSTLFKVSVKCFPIISCLKCTVNSNTVNSNFHLIQSKSLPTNDFELTVPDQYTILHISGNFPEYKVNLEIKNYSFSQKYYQ